MLLVLKLDQYGYRSNCFQMKKKSLRRFCNCIYIHNICTHKIQTLKILINMNYVIDSLAKNNCTDCCRDRIRYILHRPPARGSHIYLVLTTLIFFAWILDFEKRIKTAHNCTWEVWRQILNRLRLHFHFWIFLTLLAKSLMNKNSGGDM